MAAEREQALCLLHQVHEKLDEVSQHETALEHLKARLARERERFLSGAKEKAANDSKQFFSGIGEADHEARARQTLHEKRQSRAAKSILPAMLLLAAYVGLSVYAFFRFAQVAGSAALFNPRILFANEGVVSGSFVFTMILCLLLYVCGIGLWYRRKRLYERLFDPEEQSGNRSKGTIVFVMLFIPILMFPLWVGYLTFAFYQLGRWQAIIHAFGALAIALILAAYLLFPTKPSKKEAAYLRDAAARDEALRGKRASAEQTAAQAVTAAVRDAERTFDSGDRAKELHRQIRRTEAALEQAQGELAALDLRESHKNRHAVENLIDYLESGRDDCLEDAVSRYERSLAGAPEGV